MIAQIRTFFITGIQMEVGSQATPFEHRSFGDELALCQRYFYKLVSGGNQTFAMGAYYATNLITSDIRYPVTMRATPSISFATGTDYYVDGGGQGFTFTPLKLQRGTI